MFLVQMENDYNDDLGVALMSETEIIRVTNEMDFNGISNIKVWEVHKEIGKVKPLFYKGWQPGCLIQFTDENGNVVISGYGEDH